MTPKSREARIIVCTQCSHSVVQCCWQSIRTGIQYTFGNRLTRRLSTVRFYQLTLVEFAVAPVERGNNQPLKTLKQLNFVAQVSAFTPR